MKTYTEPEMNIIEFETEDVITTSGTFGCSKDSGIETPILPVN